MPDFLSGFAALPGYALGGVALIVLYAIQAEVRFGARARSHRTKQSDRNSTVFVSLASCVTVFGFALAVKANSPGLGSALPRWFREASLPAMPAIAWLGVASGIAGLALRLWAVLTLRERYTRTLLVHETHAVERGGPYRWVRHPGYLGSLLCLNGAALASGNWIAFVASCLATLAAYGYRVRVEDRMLVAGLGEPYSEYRRDVGALWPSFAGRNSGTKEPAK